MTNYILHAPLGRIFQCLAALSIILSAATFAAENDQNYVRFIEGDAQWEGSLETAIVSLENENGIRVNLVAAVHLADEDYYHQLNRFFRDQDRVLYELVAEPDQIPVQDAARSSSLIGFVQQTMADFLQIGFQLNEIDYAASNFLHADLTPSQLAAIMASKNESFLSMFINLAMTQIAEQNANGTPAQSSLSMLSLMRALNAENQNAALKYLFASELGRSGGVLVGAELEQQITILGDRNTAALAVLDEVLENSDDREISIFYGAAHMPGIERELLASRGFTRREITWLAAWIVP